MTEAANERAAVLLVGHGGFPKDLPRTMVSELKRLEAATAGEGDPAEQARAAFETLDRKIRQWPRNPENDPYRVGVEALAKATRERLPGVRVAVAYNEFCAPTVGDAIDVLAGDGVVRLSVLTTMMVAGGSHAAIEIPEALDAARTRHPHLDIEYHWPIPPDRLAALFADIIT
jgi:sirohydrochlorin cobaltochelatase